MKIPSIFRKASSKPIDRDPKDDIASYLRYWFANWGSVIPPEAQVAAPKAVYHPIIFRCVHRIASTVQGVDWYVQKIGEKSHDKRSYVRDNEKAIDALIHNPTDDLTEAQFKYLAAINLALYGNWFVKVGIDPFKKLPNGLYPMLSDKTTLKQRNGTVVGYTLWTPNGNKDIPTRFEARDGESYAGHIFRPTLDYVNKTHSPLQSLGCAPEIATALMERARELALGVPNFKYVVFGDRTLTAPQQDEFMEAVQARKVGNDQSGNILFLSGTNLKLQAINPELSDLHTKIPLDDMTRQIAAAFGVPIPLLGLAAADSAKYAGNFAEARYSFIEDTIIPDYLSLIEDGVTRMLCPPGYEVKFDRDSIDAIRSKRVSTAKELSAVSFLTIDEKREFVGYPPLPDGKGNVLEAPKPVAPKNETPNEDDADSNKSALPLPSSTPLKLVR